MRCLGKKYYCKKTSVSTVPVSVQFDYMEFADLLSFLAS